MERKALGTAIVDLYLEQELLMAELYSRFETCDPHNRNFWASLVADEREHAAYIQHFQTRIREEKIHLIDAKDRTAAVNSVITYLRSIIAKIEKGEFAPDKALGTCLDIEKSVVEREAFKRLQSDAPELLELLDILCQSQEEHLQKIIRFNAQIRRQP